MPPQKDSATTSPRRTLGKVHRRLGSRDAPRAPSPTSGDEVRPLKPCATPDTKRVQCQIWDGMATCVFNEISDRAAGGCERKPTAKRDSVRKTRQLPNCRGGPSRPSRFTALPPSAAVTTELRSRPHSPQAERPRLVEGRVGRAFTALAPSVAVTTKLRSRPHSPRQGGPSEEGRVAPRTFCPLFSRLFSALLPDTLLPNV